MKTVRKHQRWGKIIALTKQGPIIYDLDKDGKLEIKFEREAARNLRVEYKKLTQPKPIVLQPPVSNIKSSSISMSLISNVQTQQNKQNVVHKSKDDTLNIFSFNDLKTDGSFNVDDDYTDSFSVFSSQLSDDDDYNSILNNQDYFPQL